MTPEMFRKLAGLGLSHDQMAGVLEIFEEDAETRKAKARARVQKWRDKGKGVTLQNVTERNVTQRNATVGLTRAVDSSSISEIKEDEKEDRAPAARTPRVELETVLDGERAEAVIAHRRGLRKSLTARAAKLLAAQFAKCSDPNLAADTMIRRGWVGFEPEWLDGRGYGHGPPRNGGDPMMNVIREMHEEANEHQGDETLDTGKLVQLVPPTRARGN